MCSKNGTIVFYVNGVLAKNNFEVDRDKRLIDSLFRGQEALLDKQGKVGFKVIFNPSNGVYNDIAELYAEDYFYRTGRDDGFKVFRDNIELKLEQAKNPSRLKKIFNWKYLKQLKLKVEKLKALAKEREYLSSPNSIDRLKKINASVVNQIVAQMDDSVRDEKKVLLIGHSQGNAALKEAIKRTSFNSSEYQNFVKKYVGVFHIASPVQNISNEVTSVRSFLLSNDWIVNLANTQL